MDRVSDVCCLRDGRLIYARAGDEFGRDRSWESYSDGSDGMRLLSGVPDVDYRYGVWIMDDSSSECLMALPTTTLKDPGSVWLWQKFASMRSQSLLSHHLHVLPFLIVCPKFYMIRFLGHFRVEVAHKLRRCETTMSTLQHRMSSSAAIILMYITLARHWSQCYVFEVFDACSCNFACITLIK